MDWHLESSVLLILAAVIFIKPICSIKVCTCSQYVVLPTTTTATTTPQPRRSFWFCINNVRGGHKRYITRLRETYIWSFHNTYNVVGNRKMQQHLRTGRPKQTCRQTGLWDCQTVNHPTLKQKALMNILVTELIAVNYKLCSHCGPTKEDIPTLQSDIITKVRRTLLCVIHPWQPTTDWWPSPVKSPAVGLMITWGTPTCPRPPPPPKLLRLELQHLYTCSRDLSWSYKAIDSLTHQAAAVTLAYRSQ